MKRGAETLQVDLKTASYGAAILKSKASLSVQLEPLDVAASLIKSSVKEQQA